MADREDDAPERTPVEGVRIIGAEEAQKAIDGGHASGRLGDDELRFGDVPPRPDPDSKPAVRFPLPDDASPAFGAPSPSKLGPTEQLDLTSPPRPLGAQPPPAQPESAVTETAKLAAEPRPRASEPRPPSSEPRPPSSEPQPPVKRVTERPSASAATVDAPTAGGTVPPPRSVDTPAPAPLPHWTEAPTGEVPRILPESEVTSTVPPAGTGDDDEAVWSRFTSAPRYRDQPSDWADHDFAPGDLGDASTRVGALREPEDPDAEFDRALAELRPRAARGRAAAEEPKRRPPGLEPDMPVPVPAQSSHEGRDVPTAIVVGLAIGVGALLIFKWGRAPAAVLIAVIAASCSAELFAALRNHGYQPATLLGIVGAAGLVLATYWRGETAYPLVIALTSMFTLLWYLAQVFAARPTINIAVTMLGFGYVGVLAGFGGLLLHQPNGIGLLLGLVIPAVAYDVAGFAVGSTLGKRKLAPSISPNKTVEGLAAGVIAAIVLGSVLAGFIHPWNHLNGALLGFVVATFAFLGDLCESMFKRDMGLKDLGGLLPGHGGVLDRFDALLFALPAVYYLSLVLKIS